MAGGYTQSPGGFASPAASQGGEKKGVCIELRSKTFFIIHCSLDKVVLYLKPCLLLSCLCVF